MLNLPDLRTIERERERERERVGNNFKNAPPTKDDLALGALTNF